jgi:lipoprotein-anchoring transpeptidase ErfK/SrfK
MKKRLGAILMTLLLYSNSSEVANAEIIPEGKNIFYDTRSGRVRTIVSDFILVVLDNRGVGRFYYVDSERAGNSVIWSDIITAGRPPRHTTPSGFYRVYHKKRKWMSTKFPDPSGRNNMNYSMFFNGGIALHQGNTRALSHGCVHVSRRYASILFKHVKHGTPVIVTRESYIPFLSKNEMKYIFKTKNK